jgi:protoporphyrin/coproporphyrin ferrochelatase
MTRSRIGVLLMNVGTPDSPRVSDVRRYLSEFLGDGRVIDLPWLGRKLLVNGVIVPFRAPKSAKSYEKLWTKDGSPLIIHGLALRDGLRRELGPDFVVELAMRYQNPSIESGLNALVNAGVDRILFAPLFPQYASSSTGTAVSKAMAVLGGMNDVPPAVTLPSFYREEAYLNAFTERIKASDPSSFDHVLFSFHGLPERHIQRSHTVGSTHLQRELSDTPIDGCACETGDYDRHPSCYKMQCHVTARTLAMRAGLSPGRWSVGFQSRLDQRWVKPFSDEIVRSLPSKGVKRLLVASPAFVADCLETVIEIGEEYAELFKENGGNELKLVPSLNAEAGWVSGFAQLLKRTVV